MSCYKCIKKAVNGFTFYDKPFACKDHSFGGLVKSFYKESNFTIINKPQIKCKGSNCKNKRKYLKYGLNKNLALFCEDCIFGGCIKVKTFIKIN